MRVVWTPQAELDRLSIFQFIAADNPKAAVSIDVLFSRMTSRLAKLPHLGRPGIIAGTREAIPHPHDRLVDEIEADRIWILALVHTARRWPPPVPST